MTEDEKAQAVLELLVPGRTWRYVDQNGVYTFTEREILSTYGPYWESEMRRLQRHDLISDEHCIQDWVTVHWAWLL